MGPLLLCTRADIQEPCHALGHGAHDDGAVANSACLWGDAALHMTMAHETSRMTGKDPSEAWQETWGRGGWMYAMATSRIAMRCPVRYTHGHAHDRIRHGHTHSIRIAMPYPGGYIPIDMRMTAYAMTIRTASA